jgi:hypothetical protein
LVTAAVCDCIKTFIDIKALCAVALKPRIATAGDAIFVLIALGVLITAAIVFCTGLSNRRYTRVCTVRTIASGIGSRIGITRRCIQRAFEIAIGVFKANKTCATFFTSVSTISSGLYGFY